MTLFVFVLILSILVFVHELGHFLAARRMGIKVEEFGFGLMPGMRIWSKKIGETIYSWNILPIGGFVKLYGEDGGEGEKWVVSRVVRVGSEETKKGRAFFEKSIPQRTAVLLAGVVMNLVLAIGAFSILYYISGIPTKTGKITVVGLTKDSPALVAQIKTEDIILAVDGARPSSVEQFVEMVKQKAGQAMELEIQRNIDNPCQAKVLGGMAGELGKPEVLCRQGHLVISLIPREKPPAGEGPLGVAVSEVELKKYPWWQMPFLGAKEGLKESLAWGKLTLAGLGKMLFSLIAQGKVPQDIAGPIGIFQITGEAAKSGPLAILQFLGILSVNLAVINILPFPALDGGRLIFLGYEAIRRKKVNPQFESLVNNLGFAFLLALMVLITVNDILRLLRH